jgi:hypothetical protein
MGILIIAGVLFGIILAQFFKRFVLIWVCGLAVALVLASPLPMDASLLRSFLQFTGLIISLQFGYVVGSVARSHFAPNNHGKPREQRAEVSLDSVNARRTS